VRPKRDRRLGQQQPRAFLAARPDVRQTARLVSAAQGEKTDAIERQAWLTPGVRGIGAASLLADVGHEIPTALLPSLLTSTLGAPASALGLIEGVSDGLAGAARLGGGALADDPHRRRTAAVGGYTTTAVLSGVIGVATSVWQVGVLRAGAWAARGLRVPSRNALLADVVPAEAYGRAYGFERAMDNLGAIIGPLLAIALVGLVGVRTAILLSIIPGLLAVAAILYAIRRIAQPADRERRPIRLRVRPVLRGRLGRLLAGVSVFELGNMAATLLILRATDLLEPGRGQDAAAQQAIALYVLYNVAATLISVPAGHHGDRRGTVRVLAAGVACFALAYAGFAATDASIPLLAAYFILAGVGIGCVETAEHAAVAALAPEHVRGSAFGVLAGVQSLGNLAASAIVGVLYAAVSPAAAFTYAAVLMGAALLVLALTRTP
jgi:MFS family permease